MEEAWRRLYSDSPLLLHSLIANTRIRPSHVPFALSLTTFVISRRYHSRVLSNGPVDSSTSCSSTIRLAPDWRHSETGSRSVRIFFGTVQRCPRPWPCGRRSWRHCPRSGRPPTSASPTPFSWPYSCGTRLTRCRTSSVPSNRWTIPRTGYTFGE